MSLFLVTAYAVEVRNANEVLQFERSPRNASLAGVSLGLPSDLSAIASYPSSLTELSHFQIGASHTEHFLNSSFDVLNSALQINDQSAMGISLARFASDDIPLIHEGEVIEGSSWNTFSIADYVLSMAISRNYKPFRIGGTLHILYRELDQLGAGISSDISADWLFSKQWIFSSRFKNLTTSTARWENGTIESSPPDLLFGIGWNQRLNYFYGDLHIAWQSAGLFQQEGKSESTTKSESRISDPFNWLSVSSTAFEFETDFGLDLRGGLRNVHDISSISLGAGIQLPHNFEIDYAYQHHSSLGNVHRVGVSWKFDVNSKDSIPKDNSSTIIKENPIPIQEIKQNPPSEKVNPTPLENESTKKDTIEEVEEEEEEILVP